MKQYLDLCQRIVDEGVWVENKRTGTKCLTVINADLEYDVANNKFPLITTRKSFYKAAIAELLGYLRGYDSAAQFREIGCMTWNANANENKACLKNPIVVAKTTWVVYMVCKAVVGNALMAATLIS